MPSDARHAAPSQIFTKYKPTGNDTPLKKTASALADAAEKALEHICQHIKHLRDDNEPDCDAEAYNTEIRIMKDAVAVLEKCVKNDTPTK